MKSGMIAAAGAVALASVSSVSIAQTYEKNGRACVDGICLGDGLSALEGIQWDTAIKPGSDRNPEPSRTRSLGRGETNRTNNISLPLWSHKIAPTKSSSWSRLISMLTMIGCCGSSVGRAFISYSDSREVINLYSCNVQEIPAKYKGNGGNYSETICPMKEHEDLY